jgi:ribosome-binding factor A
MRSDRRHRVGNEIQRVLPDFIRNEIRDPRVTGIVTITDVDVSPDFAHAKVFITVLADPGVIDDTVKGLNHSAAYLRGLLAKRLRVRSVPALRFQYDASVERGARLARLIRTAVESDEEGYKSGG